MKKGPKRILVLDDEDALRTVLSDELKKEGYLPHHLSSKAEGYDWSVVNQPDMIISDIRSPGMHGFQFLRWVKANPLLTRVPFIFLSGNTGLRTEAKQMGASDFVAKPYDVDRLFATISHIFRKEWSPNLYPRYFDMTQRTFTKFLPWADLAGRIIRVLRCQPRRTAVLDETPEWRLCFVIENNKLLIGGWFFRPYEFGGCSPAEIVRFRRNLDKQGLNSGVMLSLFDPAPLIREFARLLGVCFHSASLLRRILNRGAVVPGSEDVGQISLQKQNDHFREFAGRLFREIRKLDNSEYEIIIYANGRKIKVLQGKALDGGVLFSNKNEQYHTWISSEHLWLCFTKLWLTGRYRRSENTGQRVSEELLMKLLGRLTSLKLKDNSEVVPTQL